MTLHKNYILYIGCDNKLVFISNDSRRFEFKEPEILHTKDFVTAVIDRLHGEISDSDQVVNHTKRILNEIRFLIKEFNQTPTVLLRNTRPDSVVLKNVFDYLLEVTNRG